MKKWITYALGILFTLVVLAVVGGMSYGMGFAQGAFAAQNPDNTRLQFPQFANPHSFEKDFISKWSGFPRYEFRYQQTR
jgi:hypothetical protein